MNVTDIIHLIRENESSYFGYSHFDRSNMADYDMMKDTVRDLIDVYDVDEQQAADIIQTLTH